jgi:cytochrome c-type biogenesis protein CcmE
MAEAIWEKPQVSIKAVPNSGRWKFLVGGALILAAAVYLIISGMAAGTRYYITVDELLQDPQYVGQTVRITGAVDGQSIQFDEETLVMDFTIANLPSDYQNLAQALHESLLNPANSRVAVRVEGQPKPDLLRHEAQAILTGKLGADGVFHATELFLKCPTRFQEAQPGQAIVEQGA